MPKLLIKVLMILTVLISISALATPSSDVLNDVEKLQQRWEVIKFSTAESQQEAALADLAQNAHAVSVKYPGKAEPLIWEAIIQSTYAGVKGGLSALSMVKEARDLLLQAEKINPSALDGSVYASLGNLYFHVPGWPIGFGSNKQAHVYLEHALEINPNGIEPNYFYGELLYDEGQYEKALHALNSALNAPLRQGRELSDSGQRKEIAALIENVKRQL